MLAMALKQGATSTKAGDSEAQATGSVPGGDEQLEKEKKAFCMGYYNFKQSIPSKTMRPSTEETPTFTGTTPQPPPTPTFFINKCMGGHLQLCQKCLTKLTNFLENLKGGGYTKKRLLNPLQKEKGHDTLVKENRENQEDARQNRIYVLGVIQF